MLLRSHSFGGVGSARSHGILPLPVVPLVVWVNAFTLWKPEAVRITKGKDQLATYQKTEISQRQYCRKCGGHLMTTHPTFGLVDIFSASVQVCMSITRRPYYQCVTVAEGLPQGVQRFAPLGNGARSIYWRLLAARFSTDSTPAGPPNSQRGDRVPHRRSNGAHSRIDNCTRRDNRNRTRMTDSRSHSHNRHNKDSHSRKRSRDERAPLRPGRRQPARRQRRPSPNRPSPNRAMRELGWAAPARLPQPMQQPQQWSVLLSTS